ncbi:MAG: DUF2207 domain-containing protein [Candidatus Micrarchaeota archaeon]
MRTLQFFMLLALVSALNAFSILDYYSQVTVQEDGSLDIYERIVFDLEQQYNEGYRSIRSADFGSLSDISVSGVKVNGAPSPFEKVLNQDKAEIVWERTVRGENVVELEYTIANRVELYNDFAKVCFEHYGANWAATGKAFRANTTLPPGSAGKTMHFEVYSERKGDAFVDDLSIIIDMDNVPPGNYVGGCYLFDRGSVQTLNAVDASAYAILKEERLIYGSETVLEPEKPMLEYCCLPLFLLSALVAALMFMREIGRPKGPETIMPPGKDEPVVVSSLVRNEYKMKELMAATIIGLISKGVIDILEMEREGHVGTELEKERTILMLKKRPRDLKDYENSVLDLIFMDKNEVDLDKMMAGYDKVKKKSDAEDMPIVKAMKKFRKEFKEGIRSRLEDSEVKRLSTSAENKRAMVTGVGVTFGIFFLIMTCAFFSTDIEWYFLHGENILLAVIFGSAIGFAAMSLVSALLLLKTDIPKDNKNLELYTKWDGFYQGLKSSRIKEYPPASAIIWDDILKYATALGQAKKVKQHLSELDYAFARRVERMDDVAISSMAYYGSVMAIYNLGQYGNRAGRVASSGGSGGFSSHSSGGWSGGGGGFSGGGFSGGGGFR